MGRTVITSTQLLQKIQEEDWSKFRRALRREDQQALASPESLRVIVGRLGRKFVARRVVFMPSIPSRTMRFVYRHKAAPAESIEWGLSAFSAATYL